MIHVVRSLLSACHRSKCILLSSCNDRTSMKSKSMKIKINLIFEISKGHLPGLTLLANRESSLLPKSRFLPKSLLLPKLPGEDLPAVFTSSLHQQNQSERQVERKWHCGSATDLWIFLSLDCHRPVCSFILNNLRWTQTTLVQMQKKADRMAMRWRSPTLQSGAWNTACSLAD